MEASRLQPKDLYSILWLYLTRARASDKTRTDFTISVATADLKPWPGKVVELYLGIAEPEAVLSAAKDLYSGKEKNQVCEAYFFLAEHALIAGDRAEAIRLFQQALDTAAMQSVGYSTSKEELRRLNTQAAP